MQGCDMRLGTRIRGWGLARVLGAVVCQLVGMALAALVCIDRHVDVLLACLYCALAGALAAAACDRLLGWWARHDLHEAQHQCLDDLEAAFESGDPLRMRAQLTEYASSFRPR